MKKPEQIEAFRYTGIPQQAIHLVWCEIDDIASELLSRLLEREITIEAERSDHYDWKLTIIGGAPISEYELEVLFNMTEADDAERENNCLDDAITEFSQGLARKLMSFLLPFEAATSHADDEGVWFIGECQKCQALEKPKFPKEMPTDETIYDYIIDGVIYEQKAYEDEMHCSGVKTLLNNIFETNIVLEVSNFLSDDFPTCFELDDSLLLLQVMYHLTKKGVFLKDILKWAFGQEKVDVSNYEMTEQLIRDFCVQYAEEERNNQKLIVADYHTEKGMFTRQYISSLIGVPCSQIVVPLKCDEGPFFRIRELADGQYEIIGESFFHEGDWEDNMEKCCREMLEARKCLRKNGRLGYFFVDENGDVVKKEWAEYLLKHVENENCWFVTDSDSFQCCRILKSNNAYRLGTINEPAFDGVYEFIQINRIGPTGTKNASKYSISQGTIDMNDYMKKQVLSYMKLFGYADLLSFLYEYEDFCCRLIAEMIFETDTQDYMRPGQYSGYKAACKEVARITGLDINQIMQNEEVPKP